MAPSPCCCVLASPYADADAAGAADATTGSLRVSGEVAWPVEAGTAQERRGDASKKVCVVWSMDVMDRSMMAMMMMMMMMRSGDEAASHFNGVWRAGNLGGAIVGVGRTGGWAHAINAMQLSAMRGRGASTSLLYVHVHVHVHRHRHRHHDET